MVHRNNRVFAGASSWHTQPSRPLVGVGVRVPGRGGGVRQPKPEIISPSGEKRLHFRHKTPLSVESVCA